ncbi:MAG: DUF3293 domain-containing protein [Lautropia sp.]
MPARPAQPERPEPPSAATIAAYEATDYFAHGVPRLHLRIGDPAARHAGWLAGNAATSATILTAWNPFGEELDAAQNDAAQSRLQAAIAASGLRSLPASGEDPRGLWAPEPGFCVLDASDALVDDWLRTFRQNAAVRIDGERPCWLVWHPAIRDAMK